MPTIDSKELIGKIIVNKGYYLDDPRVLRVSSYVNNWGETTYHVAYSKQEIVYFITSPHCHDIKVLWSTKNDE